ncbi:MAG TPA: GNAT family N-acetyltransferase, partial [Candidatus Cloacimonadota bacterium]|nr:GNAT family N-acetyltransferase [Candidatus Cloacimonadota bacterium]
MLKLVPVNNKKLLRQFIMLPFELYKDDPCWVPPLIQEQFNFFDPKHNPYYKHSEVCLFLALDEGVPVGRISAHSNTQHNLEHKENIGFFGFYECIDDLQVAKRLFDAAYDWNRYRGFTAMRGPMNFSVNQECGLLVDGFDCP